MSFVPVPVIGEPMQNECPLVSVILCNFNYGRFIGQAIESVLSQTWQKLELIVVDDASTDNSGEIIKGFMDPRMQVYCHAKNLGQGATFNTGVSRAQGSIVAFLDSDDWWTSNKLDTVMKWHHVLKGEYGVLQHAMNVCEDGRMTPLKNVLPVGDCFAEMRHSGKADFFVPTSGLTFLKPVLDRVFPIPEDLVIAADAYLTRTAVVFGRVYSIPDVLAFYRRHMNAVYRNPKFDARTFLNKQLRPLLNRFYHANGVLYEWEGVPDPRQAEMGRRAEVRRLRARVSELEASVDALTASRSWRLTAPLRALGRAFRG